MVSAPENRSMNRVIATGREQAPVGIHQLESPMTKLVYLYLAQNTGATVDAICADLDLRYLDVTPVLEHLVVNDHVRREGPVYRPLRA